MMNHHGPDDIYPPSRHAPVLRGKSADYLTERASEIFGGMHASAKTRYMHDQFCIGEQPDGGCHPIPDARDLATIARWLSGPGPSPRNRTEQRRYLTATEAQVKLSELGNRALFIDVRTRAEVAFLGMPTAADANIPYMPAALPADINPAPIAAAQLATPPTRVAVIQGPEAQPKTPMEDL